MWLSDLLLGRPWLGCDDGSWWWVQTVLPLGDRSPEPWSGAPVPHSIRAPPGIAAIRSVKDAQTDRGRLWLDDDGGRAAQDPLLWSRRVQMRAYFIAAAYILMQRKSAGGAS